MKTNFLNHFLFFAVLLSVFGVGCSNKVIWSGFYYYNGLSDEPIMLIGGFNSVDSCREWVRQQRKILNPHGLKGDDYECGSNCVARNPGSGLYVCDETMR